MKRPLHVLQAGRRPKNFSSLDIPLIPQIITSIKLKAVTEESKLAKAARDVQGSR
jgi:hypothetical protein